MSTTMELDTVSRVLAAFAAGAMSDVASLFHPDLVVHEAPSLSYGGTYQGWRAFMVMLGRLSDAYDVVVTDHAVVGSEDGVLLQQTMTFTSTAVPPR